MPKVLTLPKIGVNMTEATIVNWLVKEGDFVQAEQPILEAETEKATQEIPSTVSGIIAKILAKPGETVQCQQPIAVFVEQGETLPADFKPSSVPKGEADEEKEPAEKAESGGGALRAKERDDRVKISPLAKKLAMDLNLDFTLIAPSKFGGRIEREDVLAYAANTRSIEEEIPRYKQPPPEPAEKKETSATLVPLQGMRKVIARNMLESARGTARAALFISADASMLVEYREKLNRPGKKISYNDLLVSLTASAIREFPQINSRMEGEAIRLVREINIGVAADTDHGLVVLVIRDADKKDVDAISGEFNTKLDRARQRKSLMEDVTNGTFTITNLGMYGVESFVPIINPPECAILAVGSIVRQPVVLAKSDTIAVRPVCTLTLVFDHRIIDGAPAARFLQRIKEIIENPERHIE